MGITYQAGNDITVMSTFEPAPGLGFLPINTFLLQGEQPILVETGMPANEAEVLEMLQAVVGPEELRWIFLSHADRDHSGNLDRILELYPQARVVVNMTTAAKLGAEGPFPFHRAFIVNPGQTVDAGDRVLQVFQPPLYDAGGSLGFYDPKSGAVFSADTFGALIPAPASDLADVPEEAFDFGFSLFNRVNTPWVVDVDEAKFAASLQQVRDFNATTVLATHLPAVRGKTEELIRATAALPAQGPVEMPDQAALEAMMAAGGAA